MFQVRDRLQDRFLVCDGGRLFDWNLARLLAEAVRDEPEVIGRTVAGGGIGLFRKGLVDHLRPVCSLQADVLPDLAGRGLLRMTVAGGEAGAGQVFPFGLGSAGVMAGTRRDRARS